MTLSTASHRHGASDVVLPLPSVPKCAEKGTPNCSACVGCEQVLLAHLPQVRSVARSVWGRTQFHAELDDLIGYGMLGLLDAVRKYDPGRGVLLKTYAEHRIRGAILDGLRAMDWLSRSARRELKRRQVHRELEQPDSSGPTEHCAERIPADATRWDDMGADDFDPRRSRALDEALLQSCEPTQEHFVHQRQQQSALAAAIKQLPERHRRVLELYYRRELNMKQIAALLAVHESRVSQIHLAAIISLRKILASHEPASQHCRRLPRRAVLLGVHRRGYRGLAFSSDHFVQNNSQSSRVSTPMVSSRVSAT